jgi:hypothetical protein
MARAISPKHDNIEILTLRFRTSLCKFSSKTFMKRTRVLSTLLAKSTGNVTNDTDRHHAELGIFMGFQGRVKKGRKHCIYGEKLCSSAVDRNRIQLTGHNFDSRIRIPDANEPTTRKASSRTVEVLPATLYESQNQSHDAVCQRLNALIESTNHALQRCAQLCNFIQCSIRKLTMATPQKLLCSSFQLLRSSTPKIWFFAKYNQQLM